MQLKCNLSAVNARAGSLNDPSLSGGNSITCMLLASSVWAAIKRTAVSSFGACVCRWYKISVSLASDLLKKAIGAGFCKVLARAFTISLKLGFILHVWKIAVLCMLVKPDKTPSQTTSYRPISLLSAIMKLFERVIEKRLRKHLEDNGFFSKYQSGFRKSKSTNDHLFRLSQTIVESFNRGEHVIAAFLDVGIKFISLICPPSFVSGSLTFLLEE